MLIAGEFLKQIILLIFYTILIVLAVKFGVHLAKNKNLKNQNKDMEQK